MSKRLQVIFFICSVIFYSLALFTFFHLDVQFYFFQLNAWYFLAFSALHLCFLLLFAFFSFRSMSGKAAASADERIAVIRQEWSIETEEMKKMLSAKEEALDSLRAEIADSNKQNAELEAKVKELEQLSISISEKSDTSLEYTLANMDASILPQHLLKHDASIPVNIVQIARSTAAKFRESASRAGLVIHVSASDENLYLKSDADLIRVLFSNIIDNSIKYMFSQGSLIITISSVGDDIFIVLKDSGRGLSSEETSHVFELNYQGSNRISGNGLGLYQAKAIVTHYGGTIFAKSSYGSGMGIYIQLPVNRG